MKYLNEDEKRTVNMCLANISDCIKAIQLETMENMAYKGYLSEKITRALHDMQVMDNICKEE